MPNLKIKIFAFWLISNYYFGAWMANCLIFSSILGIVNIKILICTAIISICEILLMDKICLKDLRLMINREETNDKED